ncbi:hypothetical protein K788_0002887 [Paraburkholderia caribensis MBA4]|uniref:Uncharacterized protein n=1 Tax=Paraburkholderia caribensis MBA4 TaxID=1323664 RepID=A0A0P0RDF9_9BURK|nr:hypothetical protein K788_0002887 [Paraburkholderia caribensis MBA4]
MQYIRNASSISSRKNHISIFSHSMRPMNQVTGKKGKSGNLLIKAPM